MHMDLDCLSAPVIKVRVDAIVCVLFCEAHHCVGEGEREGGWSSVVWCGVQLR